MRAARMLTNALMPPVDRLPPPPEVPVRSPAAAVAGEVEVRVPGLPGTPELEARIHVPAGDMRMVVLCHPHPLYGGSMHSPVPLVVAKLLAEKAAHTVGWARFNFRGVGTSAGFYDEGKGEVDDALAILAHMRRAAPAARPCAPGWPRRDPRTRPCWWERRRGPARPERRAFASR